MKTEQTFWEYVEYYWGLTSDVAAELPLYWVDRYEPISDEE